MRCLEADNKQTAIANVLAKHGLASQPPPDPRARSARTARNFVAFG